MKQFNILYDSAIEKYPPAVKATVANGMVRSFAYYIYVKFEVFIDELIPFVTRNSKEILKLDWLDSSQNLMFIQKAIDASSPVALRASFISAPQVGVVYLAVVELSVEYLTESYDLPNGQGSVISYPDSPLTQVGMYTVESGFIFLDQKYTNVPLTEISKYVLFDMEKL
jgi:hypothetical protein